MSELLLRSVSGNRTHIYSRETGTRFGRRYIAVCGASMFSLAASGPVADCPRCLAKKGAP
jgi:hypothetical protein